MQMALIGSDASAAHSRRLCPSRAIDGTINKISPLLWVSFSAILRAVNVLPVPQAIISLPLSLVLKWAFVFCTASVWCGYKLFCLTLAWLPDSPSKRACQLIGEFSRSDKLTRDTGGFWLCMACSALLLHLLLVDTHNLWAKAMVCCCSSKKVRLDVDKKVSRAALSI